MSESTPFMRLHGARMSDNGFHITPIHPGEKFPGEYDARRGVWGRMKGWSQFAQFKQPEVIVDIWASWPGCGVGIVTGGKSGVIGIDIDILDDGIARTIRAMIEADLGETPLVRVGLAPKCMLVYRVTEPMEKLSYHPLEVLANGQQFVAYGTHPATGRDYSWPIENPTDTPVDSLPLVAPAQVKAAVERAYAAIPEALRPARMTSGDSSGQRTTGDATTATPQAIRLALQHIPNPNLSWDEWKKVLMATFAASNGDALIDFVAWSSKSSKHDDKTTAEEWSSCRRSPPRSLGFGTLYYLAKQHGWVPPADLAFNVDKDTSDVDISGFESWREEPAPVAETPTVPTLPSIPRVRRTVQDVLTEAPPEQRPTILEKAGLRAYQYVDAHGQTIETLLPTVADVTDVNIYVNNALQTVYEDVDVGQRYDFTEPEELKLTQEEIENGSLPRAFADQFPQEWLYRQSMIGRIAKWVEDRCPISHRIFALMSAFTFFGAIVGRQYRSQTGIRPNLACIMIAGTGSGKEGPRNAITKLMSEIDAMHLSGPRGGFSSGSGVVEGLVNQPNMWLAVDEFGKKIAAYGAGRVDQNQREMIAMFLEAIANDFIGGKGYANSLENPAKNVRNPNLNIFASSQMEEITGALSSAAAADGLIQRFLFCPTFADYVPIKRGFNPPPVPEDIVSSLKWLIDDLSKLGGDFAVNGDATIEPEMRVVRMTQQAEELFHQLDERKVKMAQMGRMMWVRSAAMAMKIAMLEAISLDPVNPLIDAPLLDDARKLVDWFTLYAETYVAKHIADNDTQRDLNRIKALITDGGAAGVTRTLISRKTQSMKSRDRDDHIKTLLEGGEVIEELVPTSGAGRPARTLKLAMFAEPVAISATQQLSG